MSVPGRPGRIGRRRGALRSGRGLHLELGGQLADLCRRIAPVAAKGLQERQFAFFGPAGHGLGRHVQEVGHLRGPQVAGSGSCCFRTGLGHGASLISHHRSMGTLTTRSVPVSAPKQPGRMPFSSNDQGGSAGVGAPAAPPAAVAMPMSSWRSPAVGASLSGAAPAALWDRRLGSSGPGRLAERGGWRQGATGRPGR
jgi:hypothetical protein